MHIIVGAVAFALASASQGEPVFQENPVYGDVITQPGQNLLVAFNVGVKLTTTGWHLKKQVELGTLAMPAYPASLFNAGITGEAEIVFDLKEDGSVANARVSRSIEPEFGVASLSAVKGWKLEPLQWISGAKTVSVTAKFVFSIFSG